MNAAAAPTADRSALIQMEAEIVAMPEFQRRQFDRMVRQLDETAKAHGQLGKVALMALAARYARNMDP